MTEVLIGIVSGIVSGTGMGGGTILIFLLSFILGIEQHTAQATNLIFFIPTSIVAIIVNFKNKNIDTKQAIIISIFVFSGNPYASFLMFVLIMMNLLIRDIRYYRYAVRFGMDELNDVNELAGKYPEARPMINRKQKTGSGEDETAGDN